jgi:ATP-dependent Clp protease ATP-binding subunit ClpA
MRLDRLTTKTREALVAAQQNAADRANPEVYPEHLLLDLLAQAGGLAPAILEKAGADLQGLIRALGAVLDRMPKVETEALKDEYTSAEHVLLAAYNDSQLKKALEAQGVNRAKLLQAVQEVRGSQRVTDPDPEGKFQALEKYTNDLTEAARQGKTDPVIGRDEEIRRVMQVLSRRTKNNPVLIGEPGVGKTAIAARRRAGRPSKQEVSGTGPRRDGRGVEVPRRVRGAPQSGASRNRVGEGRDHSLHRRAPHTGRSGCGRRIDGREQHAQASVGAR